MRLATGNSLYKGKTNERTPLLCLSILHESFKVRVSGRNALNKIGVNNNYNCSHRQYLMFGYLHWSKLITSTTKSEKRQIESIYTIRIEILKLTCNSVEKNVVNYDIFMWEAACRWT